MKLNGVLITVKDMEKSRQFYHDVLGLNVAADPGGTLTLEGGIFLRALETREPVIMTDRIRQADPAGELYFEEEDMEGFRERLASFAIRYVHPLFERRGGQRAVRFYDPDGHIIEVIEKPDAVILRLAESGLSMAETAARMDVPIRMVFSCLGDGALRLVKAGKGDFARVRDAYLDIIDHSTDIKKYARWEYGRHPTDESLMEYIDAGDMYMLMDGAAIAGAAGITLYQGGEYHPVRWRVDARDDEVMVLHLLGVIPRFQGAGIGKAMIRKALAIAAGKGLKACRLDTLASNTPARRFYESLGFVFCGKQHWYAENTGWTDFCLYEYALDGNGRG